jgi:uridine kinase
MIIALLGAESTGKTALAHALVQLLVQQGQDAVAVDEYLREWCAVQGRTPQQPNSNGALQPLPRSTLWWWLTLPH